MSSIYRIIFIHDEITRFGKVATEKIKNEFEITTRQVQRDVREMKLMGAPLQYSAEKNGYIYRKPWGMFDYADKKTLLFYLFAKKMTENLALVPIVAKKLLSDIEDIYLRNYGDLAERISYEFNNTETFQTETVGRILDSMHSHTAMDIEYSNAFGVNTKRTVEPWHLLNYSGKWYLLAWCRSSNELRTFHVSRIVKILGKNADPEPFSREIDETKLKQCLNDGYGIFKCSNTVKVTVRFHEPVINFVKNRTWHPNQKLVEKIVDGRKYIDLTLPVGDYTEITGIVLSYSPNAEALSPQDFRDKWLQRVKETAERFISK